MCHNTMIMIEMTYKCSDTKIFGNQFGACRIYNSENIDNSIR